jgi:hypothetical protein
MPSKPAKYGLKYWCVNDVKTAYLLNVDIYLGKTKDEEKKKTSSSLKLTKIFKV